VRQKAIPDLSPIALLGHEMMSGIPKWFGIRDDPGPVEMTVVVRVLKQMEDETTNDTYTTATVDITVLTKAGRKVFEAFHMLSVPDKGFESYVALRRQFRQSLISELRSFVQALEPNN
jgi:hypothetical protein